MVKIEDLYVFGCIVHLVIKTKKRHQLNLKRILGEGGAIIHYDISIWQRVA